MIQTTDPYFPFVKSVRRMIADEETPVPALQITPVSLADANLQVQVVYTSTAQSLILHTTTVGGPADQIFDLTQYGTLLDLCAALGTYQFGGYKITFTYFVNPLRNNDPTDLIPGTFAIATMNPVVLNTRHILSDNDIKDELDGAITIHNPKYVINSANATQTVTDPTSGITSYPYPAPIPYPYPNLNKPYQFTIPDSERGLLCMLTGSHCIARVAEKFARLPTIMTDGQEIDRGVVLERLRDSAAFLLQQYDDGMTRSGVGIQVDDASRISGITGMLSQIPEYNPGIANNVYGLRWLSPLVPNLIVPASGGNANPFDTSISNYFGIGGLGGPAML